VEAGTVARIEIVRPEENFLDLAMIRSIADALDELAENGSSRVVLLSSRGKHFCAGVNLGGDLVEESGVTRIYDEALRIFEQPLPIVCAIQGAAIGGGLGLALAADFRVAAPEARFAANFTRLGFHHGFGLTVTLPRVVGEQHALDLLVTGRRIGGEEAHRIGLCDRLVPLAELELTARAWAEEIAGSAPLAVRSVRQTMRGGLGAAIKAALGRELSEQERLKQTADFAEGVAAMGERRTPAFQGR
jgi:enoyl-CoA hydratase/carnithine racemase